MGLTIPLDGVLVTHAHSDHINYSSLRVLQEMGIPIYIHRHAKRELLARYLNPYRLPASVEPRSFELRPFADEPFHIGHVNVTPVEVPHAPGVTTHAFVIRHGRTKLLIATDFNNPEAVVPHVYNCDFIYLESNHDLELLRMYFNPASLFHMPNPAAGLLLTHACEHSRFLPGAVMLGHLSEDRNRPQLALDTARSALRERGLDRSLPLSAAPRYGRSETIVIEE